MNLTDLEKELCATIRDLLGESDFSMRELDPKGRKWFECAECGGYYCEDQLDAPERCPAEDCLRHKARVMLKKAESL